MKKVLALLLVIGVLCVPIHGLSHSRGYSWTFQHGNLASNWSFENTLEFWMEGSASGVTMDSRFKAAGSPASTAKTGMYVAMVNRISVGGEARSILSSEMPIKVSTPYTLSFYYRTNGGLTGNIRPLVETFTAKEGGTGAPIYGGALTAQSTWALHSFSCTTQVDAQYLRIILAEFDAYAHGTIYFDDLVLEEGALNSTQVAENRQKVGASVAFSDGLGRVLQSQQRVGTDSWLVGGTGYDDFVRPETTYLSTPYSFSTPNFRTDLLDSAKSYFGPSGPFDAKNYPFSQVKYAEDPSGQVIESTAPDSAWQFGKGHTVKQGFYYVNDSVPPADIENPSTNNAECKYRLDWSKSPDSTYTLSWTNKMGQVIRTANNINRSSSGANTWKWMATRYEYYPSGAVKKVRTPIDDSAGTDAFAEVSQFNSLGQVISSVSPDRNLRKFWYNRMGQLRYSQDSVQRAAGKYAFHEYDGQGRLVSEGVQAVSSLPQDSVDKDTYSQGTKTEHVGFVYDDTSTFYSRTGFTLQEIVGPWKTFFNLKYGKGRLFCKFHRNQESQLSGFSTKDKFVADFFSYDDRGFIQMSLKFIGPMRDATKRLQDVWYTYDNQGRLQSYIHYKSASTTDQSNSQTYTYDFLGRVTAITGLNGKPLAKYTYTDWGPLNDVGLGGTTSGDSATYIDYFYNSQGGIDEIASTSILGGVETRIFQQFLGYQGKAFDVTGVPSLIQKRFDGTITQQVYKYGTGDAAKPVRAVNYGYDQIGRMGNAEAYWNTNSSPLYSNQQINASALTMDTTGSLSSRFEYDLNGRIAGQRSAGVNSADSARYVYLSNSYRLDKVTGKLSSESTRNLAASGTFVYDANGAMTEDRSKRLKVAYGWDGLPVSFTVDSAAPMGTLRCCTYDAYGAPLHFKVRYPAIAQHNFYDADGNRVSRVELESKPTLKTKSTHYVYMAPGMLEEWYEGYHLAGSVKTTSSTRSLIGQTAQIGRITSNGVYEFFVKNHLGSTMLTVDDRGRTENGRAHDYLAYGSYKDLKIGATDEVTQKFTGKEFEKLTGLHHFGWRSYDSELGMWTRPDPAREYFNPYSYVGGNPINLTDPNGLRSSEDTLELPDTHCSISTGICSTPDPDPELNPVETIIFIVTTTGILLKDEIGDFAGWAYKKMRGKSGGGAPSETPRPESQAGNSGSVALQDHQVYDYYWNRGEYRIDQATHWGDHGRRIDDLPEYLGGWTDKMYAIPWYGARGLDPNENIAIGVMPDVGTPGGAGAVAGAAKAARGGTQVLEASSLMNRLNLGKQLASEAQLGEKGLRIIGSGTNKTLLDAGRLAKDYGGNAADWAKMTSSSYRSANGFRFETHWYENAMTGMRVEYKTKLLGY